MNININFYWGGSFCFFATQIGGIDLETKKGRKERNG